MTRRGCSQILESDGPLQGVTCIQPQYAAYYTLDTCKDTLHSSEQSAARRRRSCVGDEGSSGETTVTATRGLSRCHVTVTDVRRYRYQPLLAFICHVHARLDVPARPICLF